MSRLRGSAPFEVMQRDRPGSGSGNPSGAASEADTENRGPKPTLGVWLRDAAELRLPRLTLLIIGVVMLGLVGLAFRVGQVFERRAMQAYRNQSDPLKPFRETPVNPGLIPRTVSRITPQEGPSSNSGIVETTTGPAKVVDDPREPGLNYFRMLQIDASYAAEADRVIRFLADQGVDAAAIPINNGRFVKVIALRGFQRVGDEAAVAFKRDLQRLGRKWKTEHKGTTDWNDLYAEKFIPGRT